MFQDVGTSRDVVEPNERRQRADARRNRIEILKAAEAAFADHGISVPIDDIAKAAGVGVGTVYRHFPTKETLAEAVILARFAELTDEARALSSSGDPGAALFGFMVRLSREAGKKRDLIDALPGGGAAFKSNIDGSALRAELEAAVEVLLRRAQRAGAVRPDVDQHDLFGLVMGTCMFASEAHCSPERMLSVVCDGLRQQDETGR